MNGRSWGPAQGKSWGPATVKPRGMGLMWDEIRARSELRMSNGTRAHCLDCEQHWNAYQVPCLKHTQPSERLARAHAIGTIR